MSKTQPKIKGILFDLDQTLCNNEDYALQKSNSHYPAYKKTCEWELYKFLEKDLKIITWEKFIEVYEKSKKEIKTPIKAQAASHSRYLYIQRTLENLNMRFKPDLVFKATNIYWNHMFKKMSLFPDVKKVLNELKENHFKICIITDLTADIQNKKLQHLGVNKYIDYMVTSEEVGAEKPNPKVLKLALEKLKLPKEESIIIGNNPKTDVQLGLNSGVKTILFDFNKDFLNKKTRNNPTYYINNFRDILKIMKIEKKKYPNKNLFVFDMIGTLTDERHLVSGILQKLLPKYSYKHIKRNYELYKVNEISRKDFWDKFGVKDIDEMEKRFLEKIIIRDGMLELLQNMRKDFKLATLSNIPRELGHLISKKYGFEKYFDQIVFSGDYGIKKPNSEIYKLLLKKFPNIKSSKTYFIDDSLKDLESGKNLLMNTIWYKSNDVKSDYIPDSIVKNVGELKKFVKKL